jgi:hypothetical protein
MKKNVKLVLIGLAVTAVLYYIATKFLFKSEASAPVDGGGTTPTPEPEENSGGIIDTIQDVFGLGDTETVEVIDEVEQEIAPTNEPPPPPPPSTNSCFTAIDQLEPLPSNLGCGTGYVNPSNCQGGGVCIPGFLSTPSNACGAGVARWQKTLNQYFQYAGDGQCIPGTDFGRSTPQTRTKTQELIDSGAISTG